MKIIMIKILIFNYFLSALFANSTGVKLAIELVQQKITYLDALPLKVSLINSSSSNKQIYEFTANLTLQAEIRKVESKNWESLMLIDPINGIENSPENFPKNISIPNKDTIQSFVAVAPWNYKGEKVIYPYLEKGSYEIRFSYIAKPKSKPIYSNVVKFEVGDFDNYNGKAMEYLKRLSVPYFIYDIWHYVGSLQQNNFLDARKHLEYIIINFPNSNFAVWAKFFLLEAKYFYQVEITADKNEDSDKNLYEIQKNTNPFFQKKWKALLEHIKREQEKKK